MSKRLSISVAMATYNGQRFLSGQLESLAEQSVLPDELVICDDVSTDGTLKIIHNFSATAPFPVRIYSNASNLGFADNFLKAASLCQSDLIAFCDQDDIWLNNKIERCLLPFQNHKILLTVHAANIVDEKLEPLGPRFPDVRRTTSVLGLANDPWILVPGFSMTFSSSVFQSVDWHNRPYNNEKDPLCHDQWIYFLSRVFGGVAFISEPLALYRRHASTVTGMPNSGLMTNIRRSAKAGTNTYSSLAECANDHAQFLESLMSLHRTQRRDNLIAAAKSYRKLAKSYICRASLYSTGLSKVARMRWVFRLLVTGGYRSHSHGGIGSRSLLKDIIFTAISPVE